MRISSEGERFGKGSLKSLDTAVALLQRRNRRRNTGRNVTKRQSGWFMDAEASLFFLSGREWKKAELTLRAEWKKQKLQKVGCYHHANVMRSLQPTPLWFRGHKHTFLRMIFMSLEEHPLIWQPAYILETHLKRQHDANGLTHKLS